MKIQNKLLIVTLIFIAIILSSCTVFAKSVTNGEIVFSQEFEKYLHTENNENIMAPRAYDIPKTINEIKNPLRLVRVVGSTTSPQYSLKNIIPENMIVKNQQSTSICWAFSNLASAETNLALQDYKKGLNGANAKIYDFSERHMDYATSRVFLNNEINPYGFNRVAGSATTSGVPIAYLINGLGPISEEDMKFENNSNKIALSAIQNKDVVAQVNDIVTFPYYTEDDDTTLIKQQMKEHIMNHGSISANIHSASLYSGSSVYNSDTAAYYCDNSTRYTVDHAVAVVGWDDNYPVTNFASTARPSSNGAWIIRNSWGEYTGDEGYIYISYEDVNIYSGLVGIENIQNEFSYENLYQYDEFGSYLAYGANGINKVYIASQYDKKTSKNEYLTQVSVMSPETYTCRVLVNSNGTSMSYDDLQPVKLKTGDTETFDAGYHTIEFAEPVLVGENFVVALEIQGHQASTIAILIEANFGEYYTNSAYASHPYHIYDNVTVADQKCFMASEAEFMNNDWTTTSNLYELTGGQLPNFDISLKAFTTSKVMESIAVTKAPNKDTYIEGQDFDATGMIVVAQYANGDSVEISDYKIQNSTKLTTDQKTLTIVYDKFSTTIPITVEKNTVQSLAIMNPPTQIEYWAGDDFDATGMIINAIYKDGTSVAVTDFTISNGTVLKNGQTSVTINYDGKTVTQTITVKDNPVELIKISNPPTKVNYIANQNFDPEGMIVEAIYRSGKSVVITDYTLKNDKSLFAGQTEVIIEYDGKSATQIITVIEKAISKVTVKNLPTKTKYVETKEELDLTGGILLVSYNDGTNEEVLMTSSDVTASGFDNKIVGELTITLTYDTHNVEFSVEIVELPRPVSSDLSSTTATINNIKTYQFTDKTKDEYTLLNISLNNIIENSDNERIEYYYYLSTNPNEENIVGWIKTDTTKNSDADGESSNEDSDNGKIGFTINSLDVSNYEELSSADEIYLYIKQVAVRNDFQSETASTALELNVKGIEIEKYLDGEKNTSTDSDSVIDKEPGEKDDTTFPDEIPEAGKNIFTLCIIFIIVALGIIAYCKYKNIEIN